MVEVGLLVVFGGDGMFNMVICVVEGWDGEVLVLLGGIVNLFVCSFYGVDVVEVGVEVIVVGFGMNWLVVCLCNCICCGMYIVLIEVFVGLGVVWSDVCEGLCEGDIG